MFCSTTQHSTSIESLTQDPLELAPIPYFFVISTSHVNMNMFQGLMKFHQWLFKILRKQNVIKNEFNFWNAHGIMNTLGLVQSK